MVGESQWLSLVEQVWATLLGLVTMTGMALLLKRTVAPWAETGAQQQGEPTGLN